MATESDQIRADIESTRGNLADDLSTLVDRTSPKRIAARRWNAMQGSIRSARHRVLGASSNGKDMMTDKVSARAGAVQQAPGMIARQAQGSPMAVGLIAFGAGLLAAAVFPVSESESRLGGQLAENAEAVVEPATEAAKDMGGELKDSARTAAADVGGTAKQSAARAVDQAKQSGTAAADEIRR